VKAAVFHPDARHEFRESVRFYESNRRGLGRRFKEAVQTTPARILANPTRYRVIFEDVHTLRVAGFPYALHYQIRGEKVRVVAVMHASRHPDYWKLRIST
jgi:plasmid stabilization system protein ParE